MKIHEEREIVVARANQPDCPWGVWQFPAICRLDSGALAVCFSRTVDDATLSAEKHKPGGMRISTDDGSTWQDTGEQQGHTTVRASLLLAGGDTIRLERPAVADMPKDSLPPATGRVEHGYNGYYTTRDPLALTEGLGQWHMKRKPAG